MSNRTRSDIEDVTLLVNSKKRIFHPDSPNHILEALMTLVDAIETAYVLAHTPGQGEDLYQILVDGKYVIGFDLQQDVSPLVLHNVTKYSVPEFRKQISGGRAQRHLDTALKLSIADIEAIKGNN